MADLPLYSGVSTSLGNDSFHPVAMDNVTVADLNISQDRNDCPGLHPAKNISSGEEPNSEQSLAIDAVAPASTPSTLPTALPRGSQWARTTPTPSSRRRAPPTEYSAC